MTKKKKLMAILAVFVLSVTLLTACSAGTEGETGLGGEDSVNVAGNPVDNVQAAEEEKPTASTDGEKAAADNQTGEAQATINANGTLKAVDANTGMITLVTQSGDKLELKVTSESKILVSPSPASLDQLTAIIGSEVSVEYHAETKTVTSISIKG